MSDIDKEKFCVKCCNYTKLGECRLFQDIVTGQPKPCKTVRENESECGIEGKYYHERVSDYSAIVHALKDCRDCLEDYANQCGNVEYAYDVINKADWILRNSDPFNV